MRMEECTHLAFAAAGCVRPREPSGAAADGGVGSNCCGAASSPSSAASAFISSTSLRAILPLCTACIFAIASVSS